MAAIPELNASLVQQNIWSNMRWVGTMGRAINMLLIFWVFLCDPLSNELIKLYLCTWKKYGQADLGPKRKGLDLGLSYDIIIPNTKLRDIWIGLVGHIRKLIKKEWAFSVLRLDVIVIWELGPFIAIWDWRQSHLIEGDTLSSDGCWAQFRIQWLVCHFLGSPKVVYQMCLIYGFVCDDLIIIRTGKTSIPVTLIVLRFKN